MLMFVVPVVGEDFISVFFFVWGGGGGLMSKFQTNGPDGRKGY